MERKKSFPGITIAVFLIITTCVCMAYAADPIVIGVPTSLGFLEGKESIKAVEMAVEEINAAGGVSVGMTKRNLKVESIDLRDAAPGVPVPEGWRRGPAAPAGWGGGAEP